MPQIVESLNEFIQRHGGHSIQDGPREWLLPSGARIVDGGGGFRSLLEPPADEAARLELREKYHSLKAEEAEKDFDALKAALLGQSTDRGVYTRPFVWDGKIAARYGPQPSDKPYDPHGTAALLRIRDYVQLHHRAIAEIQARLAVLESYTAQQRREDAERAKRVKQLREEQKVKAAADRTAINAITIHPEPEPEAEADPATGPGQE